MTALLTKRLNSTALSFLKSNNWDFDLIESLEITLLKVSEVQEADAWIISSRNSWHVIEKMIHQAPKFIYCVGHWMANELKRAGVQSAISSFNTMHSLAADLTVQNFERLVYFCGDHHRDEDMQLLKMKSDLVLITTHQSKLTYPVLKRTYPVVFVFSPRSVESLLRNNTFTNQTTFACIGPTTAAYLHQQGLTNTFCASVPDSEVLVKEFFFRISYQTEIRR